MNPRICAAVMASTLLSVNTIANENFSFLDIRDTTKGYGFCSRSADYESKEGEWTTLELICFEDKSLHTVNGKVVMILKNSRYIDGGTEVPLQKGKIQIQECRTYRCKQTHVHKQQRVRTQPGTLR